MRLKIFFGKLLLLCVPACLLHSQVRVGADVFIEAHLELVKGKNVGLITNQTGRLASGEFFLDALLDRSVNVIALFGPEHGIRGEAAAGESVRNGKDVETGTPIYSLYGDTRKPNPDMLRNVDVLIYDIQDVGARFYTYISTMALAMEAAAQAKIPFIVLDRPNPLGGIKVDGPILEDSLKSFVGMFPIPVVYGMTCGELARMINGEGWLAGNVKADLFVIPMEGWRRGMTWEATGLSWIQSSPNIPTPSTAKVYPATCFLEATNVSEGRGTPRPFQTIGAPFIDSEMLAGSLTALYLKGVIFNPVSFTPTSSKHKGTECQGVFIEVTDQESFQPVITGLHIIRQIKQMYPSDFILKTKPFERLMGSAGIHDLLADVESALRTAIDWQEDLDAFKSAASRYFLYPSTDDPDG
jgi:beta-N-acetylhexosaminidase